MNEEERWAYLVALDEELLKGGVMLSEWCAFVVCEADTAFAKGAQLASILTAVAGIETYLRAEYSDAGRESLFDLINKASIDAGLKSDLHTLRKYRNQWVHVDTRLDDDRLLRHPEEKEQELEEAAIFAVRVLRRTIYEHPWV